MQYDQLVTEVAARMAKADPKSMEDGATPESMALWFVAHSLATQMHDQNTIKDWAHLLLGGCGKMDKEDVEQWLEDAEADDEGMEEGDEPSSVWIPRELDSFFGI